MNTVVSDLEFANEITLNSGNITTYVFHTFSPHSEGMACIYIPEEKGLFLGDSTSGDFFMSAIWTKRN